MIIITIIIINNINNKNSYDNSNINIISIT